MDTVRRYPERLNTESDPAVIFLDIQAKELEAGTHTHGHISLIHKSQNLDATKCSLHMDWNITELYKGNSDMCHAMVNFDDTCSVE